MTPFFSTTFSTIILTNLALIAFAANSILCRMALGSENASAWGFTAIRLSSAAAMLIVILSAQRFYLIKKNPDSLKAVSTEKGSIISAICLVIYALGFSLAYLSLDTATGALILFSAVQLTMMAWGIYQREHLRRLQWLAFLIALLGFIYLMSPSATLPSSSAAGLMALSGMAWGVYSIRGKTTLSPLRATGFNFIYSLIAVPILFIIAVMAKESLNLHTILLACASGALASGVGYSLWYWALPNLKSSQAAIVQLCVPIIAAILGFVVLFEPITGRFLLASGVILGAVLIFLISRPKILIG